MIFASQASIQEWTGKGVWGKKTLIDYFKETLLRRPMQSALSMRRTKRRSWV